MTHLSFLIPRTQDISICGLRLPQTSIVQLKCHRQMISQSQPYIAFYISRGRPLIQLNHRSPKRHGNLTSSPSESWKVSILIDLQASVFFVFRSGHKTSPKNAGSLSNHGWAKKGEPRRPSIVAETSRHGFIFNPPVLTQQWGEITAFLMCIFCLSSIRISYSNIHLASCDDCCWCCYI